MATLQLAAEDVATSRPASAVLSISEATSFKQLVHLSLRFTTPTEQVMRKHLADVLHQYKSELASLRMSAGAAPIFAQSDYAQGRFDAAKQPSMPSIPVMLPQSQEERLRYLEMQNQQLLSQKMVLENELTDLRQRYHNLQQGQGSANLPYVTPYPPPAGSGGDAQQLTTEINKANEIIRKLQDEIKSLRNRARTAEASARHLEKMSKETGSSYDTMRNELQETRTMLAEKTRLLAETQAEQSRLACELEEAKKLVEANEKVIEWLHQQHDDPLARLRKTSNDEINFGTYYKYPSRTDNSPVLPRLSPETVLGKQRANTVSTSSSSPTVS